mmetsp:Transcript_10/g.12  ORF Transcript_10/g.12 Transcript_10/m.12 type:complete len:242 (-) Transcript_10:11-736(-)
MLDLDGSLVSLLLLLLSRKRQVIGVLLVQQVNQVVGQVATANRDLRDEVRQRVPFVDRHCVRYALTCVHDGTSCSSSREQRKNSLVAHVESLHFQVFKHILDELLSDFDGVLRGLRDHELVLFLVYEHIVGEQVVDDLFDVVETFAPIDVALLDGVLQVEQGLLLEGLLANEPLLLVHAHEHARVLSLAEYHGYHVLGRVVVAEARLQVCGADIDHKSFVFLFHAAFLFVTASEPNLNSAF